MNPAGRGGVGSPAHSRPGHGSGHSSIFPHTAAHKMAGEAQRNATRGRPRGGAAARRARVRQVEGGGRRAAGTDGRETGDKGSPGQPGPRTYDLQEDEGSRVGAQDLQAGGQRDPGGREVGSGVGRRRHGQGSTGHHVVAAAERGGDAGTRSRGQVGEEEEREGGGRREQVRAGGPPCTAPTAFLFCPPCAGPGPPRPAAGGAAPLRAVLGSGAAGGVGSPAGCPAGRLRIESEQSGLSSPE